MTGLYNLLERVRGLKASAVKAPPPLWGGVGVGAPLLGAAASDDAQIRRPPSPDPFPTEGEGEQIALTPTETDQIRRGRVLILQHLHDRLDAAVADAYGWPLDLSEQDVLGRLVALNKARRAEEAAGQVRWLRPDYQASRFGRISDIDRNQQMDLGGVPEIVPEGLPAWPKDRDAQPFEVERAVRAHGGDITVAALARAFKGGGKRIEPRLTQIVAVLADYGRIQRAGEGRYRG